jgi:hypothetical protein
LYPCTCVCTPTVSPFASVSVLKLNRSVELLFNFPLLLASSTVPSNTAPL